MNVDLVCSPFSSRHLSLLSCLEKHLEYSNNNIKWQNTEDPNNNVKFALEQDLSCHISISFSYAGHIARARSVSLLFFMSIRQNPIVRLLAGGIFKWYSCSASL